MIGETNSILEINDKKPEYEQLINYTMLYDGSLGDIELNECKDGPSGGWTSTYYYNNSYSTWNRNADSLSAGFTQTSSSTANWRTTNLIDFTPYSYVGVIIKTGKAERTRAKATTSTKGYESGASEFYLLEDNRVTGTKYVQIRDLSTVTTVDINTKRYLATYANADGGTFTYYLYMAGLFNKDDWQTLAVKASITASSIDDILTNSGTLLSNKDAVEFMIYRCTGDFMVSAIRSSIFLEALSNSPYKTIIYSNEHWAKFLGMIA